MKTEPNDKISPTLIQIGDHVKQYSSMGLTKREYFAALLLAGKGDRQGDDYKTMADYAVIAADYLIAALNKESK